MLHRVKKVSVIQNIIRYIVMDPVIHIYFFNIGVHRDVWRIFIFTLNHIIIFIIKTPNVQIIVVCITQYHYNFGLFY